MDEKDLANGMSVCKKWNNLINQPAAFK